jgi:membrane-bound lytic murein transglycosylase D
MNRKIAFIVFILGCVCLFPVQALHAEAPSPAVEAAIPPQLVPPSEDVAQLDEEVSDDSAYVKPYSIPIILNDSVESNLEYFKTRGRAVFQIWLDRSARYLPVMKKIFREKNLPEDLVYVSMIESGFNPYAVSWCRAVGAWQFMSATGKLYGLKVDWWIDERKDLIKSTNAAAELLKDLHGHFGSWPLALASYNAGAGKVQRAVLRTRSDDFWDLRASRYIRKETKNYVPTWMAATIIAKNPEGYGFSVTAVDPFQYDEVVIEESTDLRLIARCADCTYQDIKELNPEIKRWVTPPQYAKYTLRIPYSKKEAFLANFAAIPQDQKIKWERHEVRKGETLSSLAKHYNTKPEAIRDINGLKKNRIAPGKHLLIPVDVNEKNLAVSYLTMGQDSKQQKILYRVRRGETLMRIAKIHNVTIADIREWNKGLGKTVRAGQKIRLVVDTDQI